MYDIYGGDAPAAALHDNVLVPLSRPETVESLVGLGCDMMAKGGTLRLLYVIEVPPQLPIEYAETRSEDARAILAQAAECAQRRGISPRQEVVAARLIPLAILEIAERYRAGLILMGSSQRSSPEKALFGNIVDRVLRDAPCEVVVLSYRKSARQVKYDKVLVPTAGQGHAERALDIAIHLAGLSGGSLTSLYVARSEDDAGAEKALKKARAHAARPGSRVEAMLRSGPVTDGIIGLAESGEYTLIVIGSTERPAYYKFLMGSTADEVVKRAPCNVVVVRTKKPARGH